MAEIDALDERPSKRAKLDIAQVTDHGLPGYIPLTHDSQLIAFDDSSLYKVLLSNGSTQCSLSDYETDARNLRLTLRLHSVSGRKDTALATIQHGQIDMSVLDYCLKLPSAWKKNLPLPLSVYTMKVINQDSNLWLHTCLFWEDSVEIRNQLSPSLRQLMARYLSDPQVATSTELVRWDVREFYDNVHVPEAHQTDPIPISQVQYTLYPFQTRALRWLLEREQVCVDSNAVLCPRPIPTQGLPLDFRPIKAVDDSIIYVSDALSMACSKREHVLRHFESTRGGLLAEAMGLGKTVEMISLICMHTLTNSPQPYVSNLPKRVCKATLIITPQPILQQWKQEILEHAPHLRIYHYTGIKAASKSKENMLDIFAEQDVVLTTYNIIAQEIHYAQEKPDRKLRDRPRREAPKSPLTQIKWWRCLLDEAQMVESGVSNAAVVARKIPRINAWAVTGTPIKQSHRDLYGLMLFLDMKPWSQSTSLWDHLILYRRPLFRKLIASIALRHSKDQVREELRIPIQHRQLLTIPFTAIEESHYTQLHEEMQQDCGLDKTGAPREEDWNPNDPAIIEKMRSWLQRLRQTCLHPEVGGRNRRALGKRTGAPLRTVAQVLDVMIEQAESIIHTESRNRFMAQLDQARIYEHARRSELAFPLLEEVLAKADSFVVDCRRELELQLKRPRVDQEVKDEAIDEEESAESSLITARQRLRSALEVQHVCQFFLGNVYFQLKESKETALSKREANDNDPDEVIKTEVAHLEQQEVDAYESAKVTRSQLLSESRQKAIKRLGFIRDKRKRDGFAMMPTLKYAEDDYGGIESRKIFEKLYHYCNAMNAQADQFYHIRSLMTESLCKVLIDEEENVELTGEEYEDSTKHQDEMYVYMEMMRALAADRNDAITGQENTLLKQETKQFLRSAKAGDGPAPDLMLKLLAERDEHRVIPTKMGSLRGIINELRSLASALEWQTSTSNRAQAELVIVNHVLRHVQKLQGEQTKAVATLDQEVSSFLDAMNARLDFYRALQVISDMVAPIGDDETVGKPMDELWLHRLRNVEITANKKLNTAASKKRYLINLRTEHENESGARICTICQFEFENGTLTSCGHRYCRECITLWWKEKRSCPLCKKNLSLSDFHDITYKPIQAVSAKTNDTSALPESHEHVSSNAIYLAAHPSMLTKIQDIQLIGPSYGSKIDTLIRHILHLRKRDPGSKTVIFSQYREFLEVLSKSLHTNSIVHSKFDHKDGIAEFKTNPASECFLLHAKAHAAGLNLVCASHVILCEPLINTAIELQAIARVHRIGQIRETFVWMYVIEGTVEQAIYDISVQRRLAHMDSNIGQQSSRDAGLSDGENTVEVANAKEMQGVDLSKAFAAGKGGGEFVDQQDLWGCLFGHVQARRITERARRYLELPAASEDVGSSSDIARHLRAEAAEQR